MAAAPVPRIAAETFASPPPWSGPASLLGDAGDSPRPDVQDQRHPQVVDQQRQHLLGHPAALGLERLVALQVGVSSPSSSSSLTSALRSTSHCTQQQVGEETFDGPLQHALKVVGREHLLGEGRQELGVPPASPSRSDSRIRSAPSPGPAAAKSGPCRAPFSKPLHLLQPGVQPSARVLAANFSRLFLILASRAFFRSSFVGLGAPSPARSAPQPGR